MDSQAPSKIMDSLRVHTFYMDIRGIRKLSDETIFACIAKQLKLTPQDVTAIQIDRIEGKVFVEMHTQEAAEEVVAKCDDKYDLNNNGTIHRVRLYVEDGGTDVKLHHLPPKMPDQWIQEYLSTYGEVISVKQEQCRSEFFPQVPSGVRVARIRMKQPIPSFVNVRGYNSHVTYTHQIQTCRHCNQEVHFGSSCAQNRANLQTQNKSSSLYSGVVAGVGKASTSEAQKRAATTSENNTTRDKAPKLSTDIVSTRTTTESSSSKPKAAREFEIPASMSDRSHSGVTPTGSRSSSLSRVPEKGVMEISDDEITDSVRRSSRISQQSASKPAIDHGKHK